MNITEQLSSIVLGRLIEGETLSKHTNFRIGGPAKWFVEVRSLDELIQVVQFCKTNNLAFFVFGGGSNLLVSDNGFDGVAIKIAMRTYQINGTIVRAEAGVLSSALARATTSLGLKGLEWAITLPGTIGGAIRGNAGSFGGQMGDRVVSIEVLRDGGVIELKKDELGFSYRDSVFKHNSDVIVAATFQLEEGDTQELKEEVDDKLMKRKSSQPTDFGSAGCIFKNYIIGDDEIVSRLSRKFVIPQDMIASRRIAAGWLIDQLDLKGTQIGAAKISEKHGNFIVNTGEATADQIVQLIALIKTRARNEFGIQLEEEVQLVGFNN